MTTYLLIGGLVAVGFDATGKFLLVVSHSGRGVFSTDTWQRVARDTKLAYLDAGVAIGIGPIAGESIRVTEMNYETGEVQVTCLDKHICLHCESSGIRVSRLA